MHDTFALCDAVEKFGEEFTNFSFLDNCNTTIDELLSLKLSIENHGITPSLMNFANSNRLLSSNIPEIAALETYGFNNINPQMTLIALEGVSDKIKDLTATWFHRLWNFVKNTGTALSKFCNSMVEKLKTVSTWIKDKTFDLLHVVKTQIKTHPLIATTAAVVFLIAVAPFIHGLVTGEFPTSKEEYLKWYANITSKVNNFIYEKYNNVTEKKSGTPQELGYTKESIVTIEKRMDEALGQNGIVQNIEKSLDELGNEADSNKDKDPSVFMWIRKAITFLCSKIKELLFNVIKASRNIIDTFSELRHGISSDIINGQNTIFKAQALDNRSDDHYGVDDETGGDGFFGAEITRIIHQIAMKGKELLRTKDVEIFVLGRRLLIQVIGNEKDDAGRLAPIICVCNTSMSNTEIVSKIVEFAKNIGRTVNEDLIKSALDKK